MKIRNGFVSNSSSSSFCILGEAISDEFYEEISDKISKEGLDYHYGISQYEGQVIVGISPDNIPGDMTINEIEEEIKASLIKIGIEKPGVSWFTDGGYNG